MRRIHVAALVEGNIRLSDIQSHHLRDVLRLKTGEEVQAFDDAGNTAIATIGELSASTVELQVGAIEPPGKRLHLTIASAVPKAARADWMIEKLSELGVDHFIPLQSDRSVVLPRGEGKSQRWARLATESAKQSRRSGVMRIDALTKLPNILAVPPDADQIRLQLSTDPAAASLIDLATKSSAALLLFIGPEGGWTDQENELFARSGVVAAHLTDTILRIETAAIASAAVIASIAARPIT